jgi:LruC domain-containing protein
MKQSALWLTALILSVSFSACRKDDNLPGLHHVATSDEMVVPEGFSFNTTNEVSFTVHTNTIWGKEKIRVDIYDLPSSAGGELLFSGFADGFGEVEGNLELPAGLSRVFVELNTPDGNSEQIQVAIQGHNFSCQFSNPKNVRKSAAPPSPSCDAGCVLSLPAHSGNSVIETTDQPGVYCFSGTMSGTITANHPGAIVRICGDAQLQSVILNNGASLEVAEGASVRVTNLELNSPEGKITVYYADLEITGNFEPYGTLINYGKVLIGGSLKVRGLSSVSNYGEFTIDEDLELQYKLNNFHQLQVNQNLDIHKSGVLANTCRIGVSGDIEVKGTVEMSSGYLGNTGEINIGQEASITLRDAAMIRTANLGLYGVIAGQGSPSMIKVNQQTVLNSSSQLTGSLQLCDHNGVEVMLGSVVGGASLSCAAFIPRSACNPEGNGQSDYADSDNDGVKDLLDRYPSEPEVSGIISYPSQQTYATLAFEDLWPAKGDYDFNDLVVKYRHNMVINASNLVTRIESEIFVTAVGSNYNKGLGFQFEFAPSDVASVSGQRFNKQALSIAPNGTENGQNRAVVIAFDDVFDLIRDRPNGPFINTTKDVGHATSDTVRIVINLSSPKTLNELGQIPFNPFIYVRDERGKEVHLINQPPTDLADQSFFGTSADRTDPGSQEYYVTEDNQPWALNVVGEFAHPLEKTDILEGYIYFDIWAQSGGISRMDWHVDHPGYRDGNFVYDR